MYHQPFPNVGEVRICMYIPVSKINSSTFLYAQNVQMMSHLKVECLGIRDEIVSIYIYIIYMCSYSIMLWHSTWTVATA
jgi:hypothetical protein